MTILLARIILTLVLTGQNVFDVFSTTQALKRTTAHEGNPVMAFLMKRLGHWWWIIKVPIVAMTWWNLRSPAAIWHTTAGDIQGSIVVLSGLVALYSYVLWNNYRIAWGKTSA